MYFLSVALPALCWLVYRRVFHFPDLTVIIFATWNFSVRLNLFGGNSSMLSLNELQLYKTIQPKLLRLVFSPKAFYQMVESKVSEW